MRRASEPQLLAVQFEAAERNDRALELMVGEGYRIKIGTGFCPTTLCDPARGIWIAEECRTFQNKCDDQISVDLYI